MSRSKTFFLVFLGLLFFVLRSIIQNPSYALLDWLDYPYYVWIVNQNIQHLTTLDFANFFNTNAFYPNTNTLLLSDTLLPQSIIALPFDLLYKNPVLSLNISLLITFILNYISSYYFWLKIFSKRNIAFLGALLVTFSPFVHIELGHFQMLSFWPYFFSLYFLIKSQENSFYRNTLIAGTFLAIAFLASVYISIFLAVSMAVYLAAKMYKSRSKGLLLKQGLILFLTFIVIDGVFIKEYLNTQKQFSIQREYREYIQYSAHISDYFFTSNFRSTLHSTPLAKAWNNFDKHKAGTTSPGLLLSILGLLGFAKIKRAANKISVSFSLKQTDLFFLAITLIGLVLSLGPRVNFNGVYAHIPLPYHFLITKIPLFNIIRAVSRWSFLVYVGLTYFTLKLLSKQRVIVLSLVFLIILLEYVPTNITATSKTYLDKSDMTLAQLCLDKPKVVLEIPVTHFDGKGGIIVALSYVTTNLLSSTYHKCNLVNGYGGYDLPSLIALKDNIYKTLEDSSLEDFTDLLNEFQIDVVIFNTSNLDEQSLTNYKLFVPIIRADRRFIELEPDMFMLER